MDGGVDLAHKKAQYDVQELCEKKRKQEGEEKELGIAGVRPEARFTGGGCSGGSSSSTGSLAAVC